MLSETHFLPAALIAASLTILGCSNSAPPETSPTEEQIRHEMLHRRAEAKTALVTLSQAQERYYAQNGQYATMIAALQLPERSQTNGHILTMEVAADQYHLWATPKVDDPECGALGLNSRGMRSARGGSHVAACW